MNLTLNDKRVILWLFIIILVIIISFIGLWTYKTGYKRGLSAQQEIVNKYSKNVSPNDTTETLTDEQINDPSQAPFTIEGFEGLGDDYAKHPEQYIME